MGDAHMIIQAGKLDECTNLTNFDSPPYYLLIFNFSFKLRWVIAKGLSEGEEEAHLLLAMEQGDLLQL
ncbi:hypothetical protein YC2023_051456 [Brassica napus]